MLSQQVSHSGYVAMFAGKVEWCLPSLAVYKTHIIMLHTGVYEKLPGNIYEDLNSVLHLLCWDHQML